MAEPHPLDLLMDDLGTNTDGAQYADAVVTGEGRLGLELKPEAFRSISHTDSPARTVFVDGGNGTIAESPNFVISLNRLYCGMFRGGDRVDAPLNPRIEFFSLVTRRVASVKDRYRTSHAASLFPHDESHRRYMPSASDVEDSIRDTAAGEDPRIRSLSRSLGEWRMARHAVQMLGDGDILVMDGSLTTPSSTESKYAKELYGAAQERGVVVCALAKTSRLLTRNGEPLLDRVHQISSSTGHRMWCIDVAERISAHDQGYVMAVKLHPNAPFPFRFEMLREQFEDMSDVQKGHILSSLAANSCDISFLGYPYGLVDADRYAQVRNREVSMYRALLESRLRLGGDLGGILQGLHAYGAHERLNGVSS